MGSEDAPARYASTPLSETENAPRPLAAIDRDVTDVNGVAGRDQAIRIEGLRHERAVALIKHVAGRARKPLSALNATFRMVTRRGVVERSNLDVWLTWREPHCQAVTRMCRPSGRNDGRLKIVAVGARLLRSRELGRDAASSPDAEDASIDNRVKTISPVPVPTPRP